MDIARYKEVEAVFVEAVGLPADRQAAKIRSLTDDPGIARDVRALLDEHERLEDGEFLDSGVLGAPIAADAGGQSHVLPSHVRVYRVTSVLGRGASSTVYLAQSPPPLDRAVALKLIHVGAGAQTIARFQEEQRILADLHHDGIAQVFDTGVSEDGRPFTVLEHIEGVPITACCRSGSLGWREIVSLVLQCCEAVAHAHQRNIIHRDIKPANLLVSDADGLARVKVIDFGTAKLVDPLIMTQMTTDSHFVGTLPYASPEQLSGNARPDTRTDIHALGVVLYECLCGRHPFYKKGEGIKVVLDRVISSPVPELDGPHLPARELNAIIARACEKDPAGRYSSVAHLADDLRSLADGLTVAAMRGRRSYVARKFVGRHRLALTIAGAVAVALGTLGGLAVREGIRANRHRTALRETAIRLVDDLMPLLSDLSGSAKARAELAGSLEERIDELLAGSPDDAELRFRKALVLEYQSDLQIANGDVDASESLRIESMRMIESLADGHNEGLAAIGTTRRRLIIKLGDIAKERGDLDEARARYEEHHELLIELPGDLREGLCWSFERLGWVALKQSRFDDAYAFAEHRLSLAEALLAEEPDRPGFLNNAARANQIMAERSMGRSLMQQAVDASRRAAALADELNRLEPDNFSSQELRVIAASILTRTMYLNGRTQEGHALSADLIERLNQFAEANPGRSTVRPLAWRKLQDLNELWKKYDPDRNREPLEAAMSRYHPSELDGGSN